MDDNLRYFGSKVDSLIRGEDLSREEAKEMFRQILEEEQPDLQQGSFLAALTAKGATSGEIAGGWEAIYMLDTVKVRPEVDGPLVENCGTGMDSIKTFNISTAASIVAACDGVRMAKHGARAITSRCGTVDVLEALGVEVDCDVSLVQSSIERTGIGIFNGMSPRVHPRALFRILSQIGFGSVLNVMASLANPARPTHGVRGVYSRDMVRPVAKAMGEIGYERALVVHGEDAEGPGGMDEISTLGMSVVAELKDGEVKEYELMPEDVGLKRARRSQLLYGHDDDLETARLLRVLSGAEMGARRDVVCLNAAPIFYVTGRVPDLATGVARAEELIDEGRPVEQLRDWIGAQSSNPSRSLGLFESRLKAAQL